MSGGAMGKVMVVDLSSGSIDVEEVAGQVYEQVLSGVGLSARWLYDRIPKDADPLGPDNVLGFVSGLLTGTGVHFSGRWMVVGRSPLTKGWGDANCGGKLSPAIKKCGVDAIFFTGVSKKPVYLRVVDGKADLVDASHLWGMDAIEAEQAIEKEVGARSARVAVIGPAGEKLSLISGVVTDGGRIAARSGLGAVMGSKRLKGIALSGKEKVQVHDRTRVKELNRVFLEWFKSGMGAQKALGKTFVNSLATFLRVSPVAVAYTGDLVKLSFSRYGTICTNVLSSESGDSPVMNWKGVGGRDFPLATHSGNLNPANIVKHERKKYHCHGCPLGCGGILSFKEGRFPFTEMHKVEYETCCALGTLLLNNDLETIFFLNDQLNRAGMDTISAGATVAFAMECFEKGILTRADLDGIDLRWGTSRGSRALIDKMIRREGCGELLADGVKAAADRIGKGAEEIAMHAGGQELPMHDSRFDPGFAAAYSCEPTPGRHTTESYQFSELFAMHRIFKKLPPTPPLYRTAERYNPTATKNDLLVAASKYMQVANGCGMCIFGLHLGGNLPLPEYIDAATGWDHEPEHYLEVGARIQALRQAFNFKHGLRPMEDFALPKRALGDPPLDAGPLKGVALDQRKLRGDFVAAYGWDRETAIPTRATLEGLGLGDVAADIHDEAP